MKRKCIIIIAIIGIILYVFNIYCITKPTIQTSNINSLIIASPPYQKEVTRADDIEKFVQIYNAINMKHYVSIGSPSGWSKRIKINAPGDGKFYDMVFSGSYVVINRRKFKITPDSEKAINDFYETLDYTEMNYSF